jgi:hypothetical protein
VEPRLRPLTVAGDGPRLVRALRAVVLAGPGASVFPAKGVTVVAPPRTLPGLVQFGLLVFFGVPLTALLHVAWAWRRWRVSRRFPAAAGTAGRPPR